MTTAPIRVIPEEKMCYRCKEVLPSSEFTKDPRVVSGLKSYCKNCCRLDALERYKKDPDRINAVRNARLRAIYTTERGRRMHIKHKYGLTYEEYEQLLAEQGGACAVCGAAEPGGKGDWHIDHSHKAKQIRGILCAGCNIGIGHLGEDPERMLLAAAYLREWSARS